MKDLEQEKKLKKIELFCGNETSETSCNFNYQNIIDVFDILGGKWELLVIALLLNGPKRYSELKNNIPGISEKVLSKILKKLNNEKLLNRKVYGELPIKVEYSLTKLGIECTDVITTIYNFGEKLKTTNK